MAKDEEGKWTLERLAAVYMDATGADEDEAADALARTCAGYPGMRADVLPTLVGTLVNENLGLTAPIVLLALYAIPRLPWCANGCELLFAQGMRVAVRCGVASELLERLKAWVPPPPSEPRH